MSKGAELIVALGGKPKGSEDVDAGGDPAGDATSGGLETATEEVMGAIESKDPVALREALKAFFEICKSEE